MYAKKSNRTKNKKTTQVEWFPVFIKLCSYDCFSIFYFDISLAKPIHLLPFNWLILLFTSPSYQCVCRGILISIKHRLSLS